jgi:hypothetical protein
LFAYYAYLIIGLDLDSFSPMGGSDVLQRCMNLTNNAQNLTIAGWKAFDNDRTASPSSTTISTAAMKPSASCSTTTTARVSTRWPIMWSAAAPRLTTTIENDLKKAHEDRPTSLLPQIWTDYKKDEMANIYKGKGTQKEKESRLRRSVLHQCQRRTMPGKK